MYIKVISFIFAFSICFLAQAQKMEKVKGNRNITLIETPIDAFHTIVVDEDFEITGSSYSYNLNLTKEDYILERVTYVVNESQYTAPTSFTYNGKTYDDIDASVIEGQLLVPSDWDYNIDDEMPDEVTIYGDQNQTIKTKLYRSETFVLYLELFELFGDMDLDEDYGDY
mgnify:CR=1 FL=1